MGHSLITRRFIRIKALQHLYSYTIAKQAYKEKAIEQIQADFLFDCFIHEATQKEQLAQEQATAVALFCHTIKKSSLPFSFPCRGEGKIEQSVRSNLLYYEQASMQEQTAAHQGWNQSKAYICIDYLYIILLLLEWHRMAKQEIAIDKPTSTGYLLKQALAQHPLLVKLYHANDWRKVVPVEVIHWPIETECLQLWYKQLMQSAELSKFLDASVNPTDGIGLLEFIVQTIIFNNVGIGSFFAMVDMYWDTHKSIVKQMVKPAFKLLALENLNAFVLFWSQLETQWVEGADFYKTLVQLTLQHDFLYEAMIAETAKKWTSERILLLDKLILKLALTELHSCKEIPMKVSMNEYIEIAKIYGTAKSSAFVNGMLEALFKKALAIPDVQKK